MDPQQDYQRWAVVEGSVLHPFLAGLTTFLKYLIFLVFSQ